MWQTRDSASHPTRLPLGVIRRRHGGFRRWDAPNEGVPKSHLGELDKERDEEERGGGRAERKQLGGDLVRVVVTQLAALKSLGLAGDRAELEAGRLAVIEVACAKLADRAHTPRNKGLRERRPRIDWQSKVKSLSTSIINIGPKPNNILHSHWPILFPSNRLN